MKTNILAFFLSLSIFMSLILPISTGIGNFCLLNTINMTAQATYIDYHPSGTYFAVTAATTGRVNIYQTINFNMVFQYTIGGGRNPQVARYTKDGNYLVVGVSDGKLQFIPGVPPFSLTSNFTITAITPARVIADIYVNSGNIAVVCYSNSQTVTVIWNVLATTSTNTVTLPATRNGKRIRISTSNIMMVLDTGNTVYTYTVGAATTISAVVSTVTSGTLTFNDMDNKQTASPKIIVAIGAAATTKTGWYFNHGTASPTTASSIFAPNSSNIVNAACYSPQGSYYSFAQTTGVIWVFYDNNTQASYMWDATLGYLSCAYSPNAQYLVAGTQLNSGNANIFVYTTNCFQCSQGYYLTPPSTCTSCSTTLIACAMCINASICTSCYQGYYLNTTSKSCWNCSGKIQGCSACSSSSICLQCASGYYLLANGSCSSCAGSGTYPGCLQCNSTKCLLCDTSYYNNNGVCAKCTVNNCLRCSSNTVCLHCTQGYYLAANNLSCIACNSICFSCFAAAANCTTCLRGYYLNVNTCTACSTGCLECSSTACLQCVLGYYITGSTCTVCTSPCLNCNATATNCTSCVVGYYLSSNQCLPCTNNCSSCVSSTNCTSCILGYYLTGSTCSACTGIDAFCVQCSASACLFCDTGHYLASATSCPTCSSIMPGCEVCQSSSSCVACAPGFYNATASTCTRCPNGCQTCSTGTACHSCTLGYFLSGTTCTLCTAPCASCTGSASTACSSCVIGYYLATTTCTACSIANCLHCSAVATCTSCASGYYLNGGSCTVCSTNCLSCNSSACINCNVGFYLSSGSCNACDATCSSCVSANNCTSCDVGYFFNSSLTTSQCSKCTNVDSNCITCTPTACLVCNKGFYLTSPSCTACTTIPYCFSCTSNVNCNSCVIGYYLATATSCLSCSLIQGCTICSSSSTCTLCQSGYYLNSPNCVACPAKCASCSSGTTCLTCAVGYYSSAGDCISCQLNINGCDSCTNSTTCLACTGGYYLTTGTCTPCSNTLAACSLCDSTPTCKSCQQGYYLFSGTCTLCTSSATLVGCLLCNSSSTCQSCQSGYYLNSGVCSLCNSLPGCSQCSNSTTCVDCQSGYYMNTGSCLLCSNTMVACIFCSSSSVCLQCQSGYYLDGGTNKCILCSQAGCQFCDPLIPANCLSCNSGYYLVGFTCTLCSNPGCLSCNSTTCFLCSTGYYLNSGVCTLCSTALVGCDKCTNNTVCLQCQSMFYLTSGSCTSCAVTISGCSFCSSGSTCLGCDGGYFLNGSNLCQICTTISGCLICTNSSFCLSCTSGYYLNSGSCLNCTASIANCYQCSNSSACATCQSGYTVTATGTCTAMQISGGGAPAAKVQGIQFKSFYINATALKHALHSKGNKYTNFTRTNWTAVTKIVLQNSTTSTLLTIKSAQLSSDGFTIYFYTNNPLVLSGNSLPFSNGRIMLQNQRILVGSSIDPTVGSSIALPKSVLASTMPWLLTTQDLSLNYHLKQPQFYSTYLKQNYQMTLYMFGMVISLILFLYGLLRSICLPYLDRHADVVGHIFCLKVIPLIIYPTYIQYMDYSLGFMTLDFIWLSKLVPQVLANPFDNSAPGFIFYFNNMNFASTQIFTFVIALLLLLLGYLGLSDPQSKKAQLQYVAANKFTTYKEFIFNFFYFSMSFAGAASMVGASLNGSNFLSINGLFYILGVGVFGCVLAQSIILFCHWKKLCRLRLVLKGFFLAFAATNPLYLAFAAILIDSLLLICDFYLRKDILICPKGWLSQHILAQIGFGLYVFMPDSLLSIFIPSCLIVLIVFVEIYEFCEQKKITPSDYKALQIQNVTMKGSKSNFWNLDEKDKQQKKNDWDYQKTRYQFRQTKKTDMNSTGFKSNQNLDVDPRKTSLSNISFQPKRRTRRFKRQQNKNNLQIIANSQFLPQIQE